KTHHAQGIEVVSVEATRDEHELWTERFDRTVDHFVEGRFVRILGRTGGKRNVHGRPTPGTVAAFGGVARPRIPRVLMQRDIEDGRIVPEDVLRPVAVMRVPI